VTTPPDGHPLYGPAPYGPSDPTPTAADGTSEPSPPDPPASYLPGGYPPAGQVGYPPAGYPPAGSPPQAAIPGYPPWEHPVQGHPVQGRPASAAPTYPPTYVPPGRPLTGGAAPTPPYPLQRQRPAFPHAEPQPYHLMLRTWSYAWWRPVVGLVALLAGLLVIVPVALLPVLIVAAAVDGGGAEVGKAFSGLSGGELTPSGLLYLNLTLAGLILWTWLLVRVLHSLRPRWLSSVRPKLRWRFLFACLGLAVVALVAQAVVGALLPGSVAGTETGEPNALDGRTVALLVIVLLTTPLQAAGEEYAFRGYLLQALGALLRNRWATIVLTALLFAVAHLQFDPPLFLDRFLFGLVAAWLVIRTGGLEAGIALHVLNNYLALGLAVFYDDLTQALDPGAVSWWNVPVSLTQSLVYAALAAWVASRMGLQTRTRPPIVDAPVAAGPDEGVTLEKVG
jgi:uncharacterized protein